MSIHTVRQRSRGILGFLLITSALSLSQQVRTIDQDALDSLIMNRNGKVLLLNVWATWCEPCKEEFPELVRLSTSFPAAAFEIAAVSVDYPDEIETKILPFLKILSVPFPVYVSSIASQDSFINSLHSSWSGAIPATFMYDSRGNQQQFFTGKKTYTQFREAVEGLLEKP